MSSQSNYEEFEREMSMSHSKKENQVSSTI